MRDAALDINPIAARPLQADARTGVAPDDDVKARKTAEAFEAAFLAEMLKHSGINKPPDTAGGGAGEEAFSSFLTEQYADLLAQRGGFGLAEQIFNAIRQRESGS